MRKKYYHAVTPETMEKIIADGVVKKRMGRLRVPLRKATGRSEVRGNQRTR